METDPIEMRDARPEDYDAYARLFPALEVPDPVPSRGRFAEEIAPRSIVMASPGELVAIAHYRFIGETGYLHQLMVAPEARRRGYGLALVREAALRMARAGCTRMQLSTKPDNVKALALYESVGLSIQFHAWSVELAWATLDAMPASPLDRVREASPSDDASIERAAGLISGEVASRRAMSGRRLFVCEREGRMNGFAAFDPSFPGAAPFHATSVEVVSALLGAMRPHADPNAPRLFLVLQRDRALVSALVAHGGEVKLEIVRLEGPLPLAR